MKKSLSVILILTLASLSYAQKGSVSKAKSYRTKGDLISAKAEIDVAITNEKSAGKTATWLERGQIYQEFVKSTDPDINSIDKMALEKALEAFNKVISMEKENSIEAVLSSQNIEGLWGNLVNTGGEIYATDDFAGALVNFEQALKVKPEDSLTLLYAGISSRQAEQYDKTVTFYLKLDSLKKASKDVYHTLIYLQKNEHKDNEATLVAIRMAKKAYPEESKFNQDEIDVLIKLKKIDEAKAQILDEIKRDPSNVNLYLNYAIMHDNLGATNAKEDNKEEASKNYAVAKEYYSKAVEIDAKSYVGNFNLGAIYVNAAKEYYDQVRDMDLKTYNKKGPALEAKANSILKEGLPFMQAATETKPEDEDALRALQQIYTQLKMYDDVEVIMNKLEALGKED
jgi:tetratricopeptide (TPR) repeat protein